MGHLNRPTFKADIVGTHLRHLNRHTFKADIVGTHLRPILWGKKIHDI